MRYAYDAFAKSRRGVAYIYELVVVEGPLLGRSFRIQTHTTLRIGRTSRDLPLFQDERASLDHAEIQWTENGFWVRDLDSEVGTFIDGLPIPPEGKLLGLGRSLRVGQTVLRLDERRSIPPWAGWSAAVGIPLSAVLVGLIILAVRGVVYEPIIRFSQPIPQGGTASEIVDIPTSFVRITGVDHRDLASRRVTDFDGDGRSELWLLVGNRERIVEVDADEGWAFLGEVPVGCADTTGLDFPGLDCGAVQYQFLEGAYIPVALSHPVAWIPTLRETGEIGLPKPVRVSLPTVGRLAGFLSERGVNEPVHYLICEGLLPGVQAQVLTETGVLKELERGCLGGLSTSGPGLEGAISDEDPLAIAFTANGYKALLEDARLFAFGDPDAAFPFGVHMGRVAALSARPENRAIRVEFDVEPAGWQPIADEARLSGKRQWVHGVGVQAAPSMLVASIDSLGVARFDLPGCSMVEVETGPWHCLLRRWCTPGRTFLRATEVGCGERIELVQGVYRGGRIVARWSNFEMFSQVDVYGTAGQIDVNRVRVGFRQLPQEEAVEVNEPQEPENEP